VWINNVVQQLKKDEGFRGHVYQDHLGWWTIGYGRLVDQRRGGSVSVEEAEILLNNDVRRVIDQLSTRLSWFETLPERKKEALVNMAFQLGVNGLLNFRKMLNAVHTGNYSLARSEALNSKWAQQTPQRALRVANMLGEPE